MPGYFPREGTAIRRQHGIQLFVIDERFRDRSRGRGKAAAEAEAVGRAKRQDEAPPPRFTTCCLVTAATTATTTATAALRHWFVWWFVAGLRRRRRFSAVASSKQAGTCPDQSNLPQQALISSVAAVAAAVPANPAGAVPYKAVQSWLFFFSCSQLPRADEGRLMTPCPKLAMTPPARASSQAWRMLSNSIIQVGHAHRGTKTPRARPVTRTPPERTRGCNSGLGQAVTVHSFSSYVCHALLVTDLGALFCCNVCMCQVSCLFIYSKSDGAPLPVKPAAALAPALEPEPPTLFSGSPCSRSLHVAPERTGPNRPPNQSVPSGRAQNWEEMHICQSDFDMCNARLSCMPDSSHERRCTSRVVLPARLVSMRLKIPRHCTAWDPPCSRF